MIAKTHVLPKILILFFLLVASVESFAQILYIPSGSSGIGGSTNGNVGIGIASPSRKLEVKDGDIYINNPSADGGTLRSYGHYMDFRGSSETAYAHRYYRFYPATGSQGPTYSVISLYSGATDETFTAKVNIASSGNTYFNGGNVGIGTTNPKAILNVNGNVIGYPVTTGTDQLYGLLRISSSTPTGVVLDFGVNGGNEAGGWIQSTYSANLGNTYKLLLNPNGGNVGIGTTNPVHPLHSVGNYDMVQLRLERTGSAVGFCDLGGSNGDFRVWSGGFDLNHMFVITGSKGNVLIGKTTQTNDEYMLDVAGKVRANEVVINTTGADFVFSPSYKLRPLTEVELHIQEKGHLPEVPSAAQMQLDGVGVSELQTILLQKVEELTLYLIEQQKVIKAQEERINSLENKIE